MAIVTIKSIEGLEAVRAYWENLQVHPNSDFDHFRLVCGLRKNVISPYVFAFLRNDEICGLLIARLERSHFVPSIGYLKLFQIPAKIISVLHQGFIGEVDARVSSQFVEKIIALLNAKEADAVVLNSFPDYSPLLREVTKHCSQWLLEQKPNWSKHWSMNLAEKPGFLLRKMKSKHRSWIRKRQRDLETDFEGKINWQWMTEFYDIAELCARIEFLAARTYQRGLGVGFKNDAEYRQRLELFSSQGKLRVQVLEVRGEIAAFWIGVLYNRTFYSWSTGFDPKLRDYEIGTLLFLRLIDELVKERIKRFDFGLGDAHYKKRFGDNFWHEASVNIFAQNTKGIMLRSTLWIFDSLDRVVRTIVMRTGVLDALKSRWRRCITR